VRDALNSLVADGVLEITRGRTVRVPTLGKERVVELHEIRCALEELAVSTAAPVISPATLDRAAQLLDSMEAAFEDGQYESYIDAHFSFHFTLYAAANRPALANMIESLWLQLGPSFRIGIERARDLHVARADDGDPNHVHRLMLAALRARDPQAAAEAVRTDIMTGMEVYLTGTWPSDEAIMAQTSVSRD